MGTKRTDNTFPGWKQAGWRRGSPWPRGPRGRCLCKWCGVEVPRGRRFWCSDRCVEQFSVRNNPGYARVKAYERDCGYCDRCGLNIERLQRRLDRLRYSRWDEQYWLVPPHLKPWYQDWQDQRLPHFCGSYSMRFLYEPGFCCLYHMKVKRLLRAGFNLDGSRLQSLFQADHIHPVSEGGGGCGLDNLRTLCVPCHKAVTAAWRRRRKKLLTR